MKFPLPPWAWGEGIIGSAHLPCPSILSLSHLSRTCWRRPHGDTQGISQRPAGTALTPRPAQSLSGPRIPRISDTSQGTHYLLRVAPGPRGTSRAQLQGRPQPQARDVPAPSCIDPTRPVIYREVKDSPAAFRAGATTPEPWRPEGDTAEGRDSGSQSTSRTLSSLPGDSGWSEGGPHEPSPKGPGPCH